MTMVSARYALSFHASLQFSAAISSPMLRPCSFRVRRRKQPQTFRAQAAALAEAEQVTASSATLALSSVSRELQAVSGKQQLQLLMQYARQLPGLPEAEHTWANRVMGCTTQVWVTAFMDAAGHVQFAADSDSQLTKGLACILVKALSGLTPPEVAEIEPDTLADLGLDPSLLTPSRSNGFLSLLQAMRKRARLLSAMPPAFPSLVISGDECVPQGAFAEAQAEFLQPDAATVQQLGQALQQKRMGVVAHFYMDPQVQGVLTAASQQWPHIHISDSLVMADAAVKMAEAGCSSVAVLGVDFMSENVRAILDEAGFRHVKVYRMAADSIGCSLAEAAESQQYTSYLQRAAQQPNPGLHVVYINTSLRTKALSHAAVPTITCTSSNVVQTVLQAFAQVLDLHVWYGPDSYMGANLAQLFTSLAFASDAEVQALHPGHTAASVRSLLPRLHHFTEGICIVHHMFGSEVTDLVKSAYPDAYLAAHFEVPGEMFTLAMEGRKRGAGVVGSTQNILDFIAAKLHDALQRSFPERVQVILGTESGMITAIVRRVQSMLKEAGRSDVDVEIIFPVATEAITRGGSDRGNGSFSEGPSLPGGLAIIPGPAGGEGCSSEGGCASCPYMKMNSLASLQRVCNLVDTPGEVLLEGQKPHAYSELVNGRSMASAGCEPILHMRGFQKAGKLPAALEADILARASSQPAAG